MLILAPGRPLLLPGDLSEGFTLPAVLIRPPGLPAVLPGRKLLPCCPSWPLLLIFQEGRKATAFFLVAFPVFLFPPLPISAPVYIKSSPARRSLPLYGLLKVGGMGVPAVQALK